MLCDINQKLQSNSWIMKIRYPFFLLQCLPNLTLVELFFGNLKGLSKAIQNINIKLSKKEGSDFIATQIKNFKKAYWEIWDYLYQRLIYYLEEARLIVNGL